MGKDTHALSRPAERVALEVLAGNGIETFIQRDDGFTPTPVISHAILGYNRGRSEGFGDGIVVTPSHNPPTDGGFKYNPPNGGPADTDVTDWIQNRANELLRGGNKGVQRIGFEAALKASTTHAQDFVTAYVEDLANVIDLEAIRSAGVKIGVDPLGGAAVAYWQPVRGTLRHRYHRRESEDRSNFRLHDSRSRWKNPDGLLEPMGDGRACPAQGPFRHRLRQRSGRRPARNCHALFGSSESESLSRRRDSLSPRESPAMAESQRSLVRRSSAVA